MEKELFDYIFKNSNNKKEKEKDNIINKYKNHDNDLIKGLIYHFYLKDYIKAKELYELAIEKDKNNSYAYNNLALLYHYGNGIEQYYIKAKELYELAIKKDENNSYAYCNLGLLYKNGDGVEKDYIKAKELYELGIEKDENNSYAYCNLGYLYHYGYGVIQDYKKAIELYELAIEKDENNSCAYNNLNSFPQKYIIKYEIYKQNKEIIKEIKNLSKTIEEYNEQISYLPYMKNEQELTKSFNSNKELNDLDCKKI